jgi:hypothetical protein
VIVHSPQVERDTILLDTVTGKTWSRVEVTDMIDEPPAWDPMPQLNTPADVAALAGVHGWKKGSTKRATPAGALNFDDVPMRQRPADRAATPNAN